MFCKLYLVYFNVRFAASSFSWKKQSNLFYQENHEINKICIISKHIKQFFVILFLLIFLQIVPFFSFGWPRKSFLLDKRLRYPGEEVWYYDGGALNVMTAMYKHINPTFPVPPLPTSYSLYDKNMKIWIFKTKTPVLFSRPVTSLYLSVTLRDSRLSYTFWQIEIWLKIKSSINIDKDNFFGKNHLSDV